MEFRLLPFYNSRWKGNNIMKKALKFSGIAAFVLALVAFILMLACPSLAASNGSASVEVSGTMGIFGGEIANLGFLGKVAYKGTWSAIIAFILIIVAMIILLAGFLLPLFKIHTLDKFAGILNLVAVIALIVAGIFLFIELPCFAGVNWDGNIADGWGLGAGWIIAGILSLLGGVVAILPAVFDFLGKGK